jgi:hypothetical protein
VAHTLGVVEAVRWGAMASIVPQVGMTRTGRVSMQDMGRKASDLRFC